MGAEQGRRRRLLRWLTRYMRMGAASAAPSRSSSASGDRPPRRAPGDRPHLVRRTAAATALGGNATCLADHLPQPTFLLPATTPSSGPATSTPSPKPSRPGCTASRPTTPTHQPPAQRFLTGSGRRESRPSATRVRGEGVGLGERLGSAGLSTDWWEALLPALAA